MRTFLLALAFAGALPLQGCAADAYRLGNEETARRFLFCSDVYGELARRDRTDAAKAVSSANAARSSSRAAALLGKPDYDLVARRAHDSFLEQMDETRRAGGSAEQEAALSAFEADCRKHGASYGAEMGQRPAP